MAKKKISSKEQTAVGRVAPERNEIAPEKEHIGLFLVKIKKIPQP